MAIAGMARNQDPQAVVVLLDCAGGQELQVVRDALTGFPDTPAMLIGRDDLATTSVSFDLDSGVLEVDGVPVRPVVCWVRHGSACALLAQARPADAMRPLDAQSWSVLLAHLADSAGVALPGSAPAGPGQLADAARLGIAVPRTVLATDVGGAVERLAVDRVVVKTQDFRLFEPDRATWGACLPEIAESRTAAARRPVRGRPVVVQEYVAHDRELRVYFLDGGICAFEVSKPEPSSLWTDPGGVTVRRVDCPPAAVTAVRTLCAAWRLRFGAFDLLVPSGDGSTAGIVFLEVNPDGDWLWFERKARWHGVSFMAAVMVRELFIRGSSLGARADDCDVR